MGDRSAGGSERVTRRGFVLGGLLVAAGCSGSPGSPGSPGSTGRSGGTSSGTTTPGPTSPLGGVTTGPTTSLPAVTRWMPDAGDVSPRVKEAAVRVVEAIGTWSGTGGGLPGSAARRLLAIGQQGRLVEQAPALLTPRASAAAVEVIEAQYGGILADSASVLVACRQWTILSDGSLASGGTTVDVRLAKAAPRWVVTALHPARPGPALPRPSPLARRVLASPRLRLPPAARADVASGHVHDSVLTAMLHLSTAYRIGVSVVRSGHPLHVFGTNRLSDHPQGRAFDTFAINGRLVVDPATPRDLVTGYMQAVADAGSYNVGGPTLLAGTGNQFFSDATHHDHVHAGFAT